MLEAIAPSAADVAQIVAAVAERVSAGVIEIPEIIVLPDSNVTFTFRDFDLTGLDQIAYRPLSDEITIVKLRTEERSYIRRSMAAVRQDRLEDYLVGHLFAYSEVDYDAHADLLYKLAGQIVHRLRSYLADDSEVEKVLLDHGKALAAFVFKQMMAHYQETDTTYRVRVERGFQVLQRQHFNQPLGFTPQDFKTAVRPLAETKRRVFVGFAKCCYDMQSFQSDDERRFAVLINSDSEPEVERWVKPGRGQFIVEYHRGERYEPDFVVETMTEKLICEIKARGELEHPDVVAKAKAARTWVGYANDHAKQTGGKPWRYALIPHDAVIGSATLAGLIAKCELGAIKGEAVSG